MSSDRFRVVTADCPWQFSDNLPGESRGASKNYVTMGADKVMTFLDDTPTKVDGHLFATLADAIDEDALLFLWRVSAMQDEALAVMRAWGFTPKSEIVWVKTNGEPEQEIEEVAFQAKLETRETGRIIMPKLHFGMGHYTRQAHETCLIGRKGAGKVKTRSTRSVFFAPVGEHSEKPEAFYKIVEEMCDGPYLELFARRSRPGWTCLGKGVRRVTE